MDDAATYRFRSNAFVGSRTYRLTDDALTIEEEGKPLDGAFYDQIAEVALAFAPTRVSRNRYRTRVIFRAGGMAELFNTDYRGLGDLPEQNAAYTAFVTELNRRLAAKGRDIRYRTGNTTGAYLANLALTVFVFAILAFALFWLLTSGLIWIAVVKVGILAAFVPTLLRYIRRAKPAGYDPLHIPPTMLP